MKSFTKNSGAISILLIFLLAVSGCGNVNNVTGEKTTEEGTAYHPSALSQDVTESSNENQTEEETENMVASTNENGLYDFSLFNYCYNYSVWTLDKQQKLLLICNSDIDDMVYKYQKDIPFAIYNDLYKLTLIKIEQEPNYTLDMDFCSTSSNYFNVSSSPDDLYLIYTRSKLDFFSFDENNEIEMNGKDYFAYVKDRSIAFRDSESMYYGSNYRILKADKGEKFSISSYEGVKWTTYEYVADIPFFLLDDYESNDVIIEKTKNGYFLADFSSLDSGRYFVDECNCIIDLC